MTTTQSTRTTKAQAMMKTWYRKKSTEPGPATGTTKVLVFSGQSFRSVPLSVLDSGMHSLVWVLNCRPIASASMFTFFLLARETYQTTKYRSARAMSRYKEPCSKVPTKGRWKTQAPSWRLKPRRHSAHWSAWESRLQRWHPGTEQRRQKPSATSGTGCARLVCRLCSPQWDTFTHLKLQWLGEPVSSAKRGQASGHFSPVGICEECRGSKQPLGKYSSSIFTVELTATRWTVMGMASSPSLASRCCLAAISSSTTSTTGGPEPWKYQVWRTGLAPVPVGELAAV
mmetsp:Transcript_71040/g.169525  ORF Transcript_71040/g.169525 Transcript_71040/m.169525 type:complete len:285 (+) Transcript_71040:594-1448(+)